MENEISSGLSDFLSIGVDMKMAEQLIKKGVDFNKLIDLDEQASKTLGINDADFKKLKRKVSRPRIPSKTVSKLLFESQRTCCLCRVRNQSIIIHHIDEWQLTKSHNEENLVVLCLNCHNEVHTKHDFSRNITPQDVRYAKKSWIEVVKVLDSNTAKGVADFNVFQWDFINVFRVFDLGRELNIPFKSADMYSFLLHQGIINEEGVIRAPDTSYDTIYIYQFPHRFELFAYIKSVLKMVLGSFNVISISSDLSKQELMEANLEDRVVRIQSTIFFKSARPNLKIERNRKGYVKVSLGKIEFNFDPYFSMSHSSNSEHLMGRNRGIVIAHVRGIHEEGGSQFTVNVRCLAIGSAFRTI